MLILQFKFTVIMQIYYSTSLQGTQGQRVELTQELCYHLGTVLRHKVGDIVMLCNGCGVLYECKITEISKKRGECEIINIETDFGTKSRVTVAIAPTKNIQRTEWAVEKMVEIGVRRIVPLICDRSQRRDLRADRLEKIAISAAQQSLKGYLTEICPPTAFSDFIANHPATTERVGYIAHCDQGEKTTIQNTQNRETIILIGPEGDFSPQEVERATQNGYKPITLGESRLRTETAAVVATFLAQ